MNSNKQLIKVVADQYGSPTSTLFLANKITELIGSTNNCSHTKTKTNQMNLLRSSDLKKKLLLFFF
jgi:dTDP-4-dehydrorhamnose reductase